MLRSNLFPPKPLNNSGLIVSSRVASAGRCGCTAPVSAEDQAKELLRSQDLMGAWELIGRQQSGLWVPIARAQLGLMLINGKYAASNSLQRQYLAAS